LHATRWGRRNNERGQGEGRRREIGVVDDRGTMSLEGEGGEIGVVDNRGIMPLAVLGIIMEPYSLDGKHE
jgi:hypothetical protein